MNMESKAERVWAIGLMSGTSLDGIDAALIRTDGEKVYATGESITVPYDSTFRDSLRNLLRGQGDALAIEKELTIHHAAAVRALLEKAGKKPKFVKVIGFHGQTITHRPAEGITWQIGNGAQLAAETGIDVVTDFRRADVAAGGQGAPLVPLFHVALAAKLRKPCVILNVGGVANLTFVGTQGRVLAFDTGPGNALINDLAHAKTGLDCDRDGHLARTGKPDLRLLTELIRHRYFSKSPPKSLDRDTFDVSAAYALSAPDAAATLTHFTAAAVQRGLMLLPQKPVAWYVCGGGRHNPALMDALAHYLGNVRSCDELGWNGDALEAQAFGFLAVRSLRGLPLSLPTTTGVSKPTTGGAYYRAACVLPPKKK